MRPHLEQLETRLVPYSLGGSRWANPLVSVSIFPAGVDVGGAVTRPFDGAKPVIAAALNQWAEASDLDFHFVADDGSSPWGPGLHQGDPRFGDIRIGLAPTPPGVAGWATFPFTSGTDGGTAIISTSVGPNVNTILHEIGHTLGLGHSQFFTSVLWPSINGRTTLGADDVAGIQAVYGPKKPDAFEGLTYYPEYDSWGGQSEKWFLDRDGTTWYFLRPDLSFVRWDGSGGAFGEVVGTRTAAEFAWPRLVEGVTPLTGTLSASLHARPDVDLYRVDLAAGFRLAVSAAGLSLLDPRVTLYDLSGNVVVSRDAGTFEGTVTLTAADFGDASYVYHPEYDSWGGAGEKWYLRAEQWYYLLPGGGFYAYDGSGRLSGTFLGEDLPGEAFTPGTYYVGVSRGDDTFATGRYTATLA